MSFTLPSDLQCSQVCFPSRFLDCDHNQQFDEMKRAYADLLYRWCLLEQHAMVCHCLSASEHSADVLPEIDNQFHIIIISISHYKSGAAQKHFQNTSWIMALYQLLPSFTWKIFSLISSPLVLSPTGQSISLFLFIFLATYPDQASYQCNQGL